MEEELRKISKKKIMLLVVIFLIAAGWGVSTVKFRAWLCKKTAGEICIFEPLHPVGAPYSN